MRSESPPTIFLSNFHPFITRNILDSGVLDLLLNQTQIVIFVNAYKEKYFKDRYERKGLIIEGVDLGRFVGSRKNVCFNRVAELLLDTKTKKFHKMENLLRGHSRARYYLTHLFTKAFSHINLIKDIFRTCEFNINRHHAFSQYFDRYQPSLVFLTDVFNEGDLLLLKDTRIHGVRDICMIRSWDNATNKNFLRVLPSQIIVQNEVMKQECVTHHQIKPDKILTSGVTQFEYYRKYVPISREEFCKKIGADSSKRLILFSPAGGKFIDTDWQICVILQDLFQKGLLPDDVQIIVRLHPHNPIKFENFTPDDHFIIEKPGVLFLKERAKDAELPLESINHLADTLTHSSLVINVVSSMMIDAAVFDKPIITIGFDGWEKTVPFVRSVGRCHQEECLEVLFSSGATRIVTSKDQLTEWINKYLDDPSIDRNERKDFIEEHCWKFDGKAGERIASYILNRL